LRKALWMVVLNAVRCNPWLRQYYERLRAAGKPGKVAVIEPLQRERGHSTAFILQRLKQMPYIMESIHPTGPGHFGVGERGILALLNPQRLRRILTRMLDENEFLSPYGLRSLSKYRKDHPYVINVNGQEYRVDYLPAESAFWWELKLARPCMDPG
jgi:hypothetical protein